MVDTHPRMADFYFIRHAPVVKQSGHLPPHDPDIADGPYKLDPLIALLPENADWHISPLRRTQQTAALLTPGLAPHSQNLEGRLVEMAFGKWDDQPVADVWAELANGPKHNWSFLTPEVTPPGGESYADLCVRVSEWLDYIAATLFAQPHQMPPQIVVSHSGVLRAVMRHVMQTTPEFTIGIPITHFGCLHLSLMEPDRAIDAGGAWQLNALHPHNVSTRTGA